MDDVKFIISTKIELGNVQYLNLSFITQGARPSCKPEVEVKVAICARCARWEVKRNLFEYFIQMLNND